MDAGSISLLLFGTMLALLASGLWVAPALLAVGFVALNFFSMAPAGSLLASTVWDASWKRPATRSRENPDLPACSRMKSPAERKPTCSLRPT